MTDSISLPRRWLRWPARVAVWLVRALVLVVLVLVVLWGTLHFLIVPRIDVFRPWLLEQAQQHSGLRLELDAMGWCPRSLCADCACSMPRVRRPWRYRRFM